MRISDWSSDVCASDLIIGGVYDDLEIGSGASNNISTGAKMSGGTVSDNGTDSTFLDCPGVVDKAPAPAPSALTLATNVGEYSLNGHQPPRYYRTRSGTVGVIGAVVTSAQIRSEEHTSELQSLMRISYAVFCLKKKK